MPERRILMGVVGRPHGVRGLMHVHSYTADPADLADYGPFHDERGRLWTLRWLREGIAELSELVNGQARPVTDRDGAQRLVNLKLYADRESLPPPEEEEFYLADLIGLEAVTADGVSLGRIAAVHDYGAGASLEIGELMVPFTRQAVPAIDIAAGKVTVIPPVEIVPDSEDAGMESRVVGLPNSGSASR
jgi:16S rRNA processing protein RimM